MEYKEFCRQRERMCVFYGCKCRDCSFGPLSANECFGTCMARPEESEQKVKQWMEEHPIVTNSDKFREVFGKPIGSYGAPCPNGLTIYENGTTTNLEWLHMEYKEPEEDGNGNDR